MDNLSIFLFAIAGISTLVGAFYLMASAATSKPVRDYNAGTWTTQVKKPVHPEMKDIEPGTELMGVNFEQKTTCNIDDYGELQRRIAELKGELEDLAPSEYEPPWDDEEDEEDDDGGDVVISRR